MAGYGLISADNQGGGATVQRLRRGLHEGIHYVETSPAPPGQPQLSYLLLHGLGGSLHQWREIQLELGRQHHTIAVDIPGFGEHRMKGPFSVGWAAQKLAQFCKNRRLSNCILVAHSIGGVVAGALVAMLPGSFNRVVLVNGTLFRAAQMAQHPTRCLREPGLGVAVGAQFLYGMVPVAEGTRSLLARSMLVRRLTLWPFVADPKTLRPAELAAALAGTGSPAVLDILLTARKVNYVAAVSRFTQPVDLVWGDRDRLISSADVLRMREVAHVHREHMLSNCGHWPMVERPTELSRVLGTWAMPRD